jgi:polysaccharide export outer membrane protein
MNRLYWFLPLALLYFSSCVPNRKVVYLQKEDVSQKDMPTDTVLRTYPLDIKEYKIQPLDLLYIRIESLTEEDFDFIAKLYPVTQNGNLNAQFLSGFLVDNKGEVEFPVVGKIYLSGLSIFEAQNALQKAFAPYLRDPVARVRLLNFRFTVLGEVNRENQVTSNNPRVTLMEAVGLAGGLTDLADRSKVKVIRQKGNTSEVYYINLLEEDLLAKEHYYVQQNDIIIVPALRQRPFRKYFGQNMALFVSTVSVILLTLNLLK